MNKGIVKFFNSKLGYGFIRAETGEEIFVHYSNIICDKYKRLDNNAMVIFDTQNCERGIQAVNVKQVAA